MLEKCDKYSMLTISVKVRNISIDNIKTVMYRIIREARERESSGGEMINYKTQLN